MTGTIDLSVEQLLTIGRECERDADVRSLVRVILHPAADHAVRVVTRAISFGDVIEGYFFVTRDGQKLTGKEHEEYEAIRAQRGNVAVRNQSKAERYDSEI